jgi:hypothetical protein
MAIASPARSRRAPARQPARPPAPAPARKRSLGLVEAPATRSTRSTRGVQRYAALIACTLVVGSLLATVAAHAYLTQGQVRLARLQQQVAVQLNAHRDLELQVAVLEDPSHLVAQAQRQGLNAPSQVGDLPQVSLTSPLPAAPAPAAAATTPATTPATTVPAAKPAPKATTVTTPPARTTTTTTTAVPVAHAGGGR